LARRATAISQFREQAQGSVLVLDGGNSPLTSRLILEAMNAMEYDAAALGFMDMAST
jgi:2',3'-cyclic-nucleotide 2'-phosphodiesterase (5'-nucleotidase family)